MERSSGPHSAPTSFLTHTPGRHPGSACMLGRQLGMWLQGESVLSPPCMMHMMTCDLRHVISPSVPLL